MSQPFHPPPELDASASSSLLAKRVSVGCSLVAALIGGVTIVGWVSGMETLASLRVHYIPMAPATALCFALLGFAIIMRIHGGWLRVVSRLCTVVVALVAAAKLFEFFSGHSLGFDELFVADPTRFGAVRTARMAPLTALNFLLSTTALQFVMHARLRRFAGIVATFVTALSVVVLLGYLHGTPLLYGGSIIPVALPTAVAFFFIGCSLIAAAGPTCWPWRPFSGSSTSSLLLRWFLPVVVVGMILNDYLQTHFAADSRFNPALTSALATLAFALLIGAIISQVARVVGGRIDRAEAERNAAQAELMALNADLELRIADRTAELRAKNDEMQILLADLTRSHEKLKRIQLQLIQMEKMQSVSHLAAGVAHEVKNPMAIIEMGLDCLTSHPAPDADTLRVVLHEMQEAVSRANLVISSLLNYSSSKELNIRSTDLHKILEHALGEKASDFSEHHINVVRAFAPDLPACEVDAIALEQVFGNLLANAAHAMPEGGTLRISTTVKSLAAGEVQWTAGDRAGSHSRQGKRAVEVLIQDSGSGISAEDLAQLFDPFFTTRPTGQGLGLGLTVARKIVDLHGGQLTLANAPEGGVVATVQLPLP